MKENIKERKAFLFLQVKVLELEERIEKLEGNQSDKKCYALDGVTELKPILRIDGLPYDGSGLRRKNFLRKEEQHEQYGYFHRSN